MDLLLALGIICSIMALIAFVGNEFGIVSAESFLYDLLNFVSAAGLLFFAYKTNAVPFMITNSVWAIVSGIDVAKYLLKQLAPRRGVS